MLVPSLAASLLVVKVLHLCDASPQLIQTVARPETAGLATVSALDAAGVAYVGSAAGIASIARSPHGDEALELLGNEALRAYGWCYLVDGQQPSVMPDEYVLPQDSRELTWFFAYSTYDRGEWVDFCEPVHELKPPFICQQ